MPRLVHMTWVASEHRWKKMYKGVRYAVSTRELGTAPTMSDSLLAANEWWEDKLAELRGKSRHPAPGSDAAKKVMLEAFTGSKIETPDAFTAAAESFMTFFRDKPMPPEVADAMMGVGFTGKLVKEVDEVIDGPVDAVPPDRTIGSLVDLWVRTERSRIKTGKVGASRVDMNRICLCHFRDWIGATSEVSAINGAKWLEWFHFLSEKIDKKVWKESHVDRIHAVSKRFVRFLWEMELIDLPRNLDKKDLSFSVSPEEIEIFTDAEVVALWSASTAQTRLHVLLMLNCGMVGMDINNLRHDEIDWEEGVITRKRSKTKKHETVPVVRYKLWPETFRLLRQYKSPDPEIVLLTQHGKRWIVAHQKETSWHRCDSIASVMRATMARVKVKHAPTCLRATAASKLGEHPQYKFYAQYFLGHSPRGVAEKHYVKPTDAEFFEALAWLREQLLPV